MRISTLFLIAAAIAADAVQGVSLTFAQQLELSTTAASRVSLLAQQGGNSSFVFDFNAPPSSAIADKSNTSRVISANANTYPALEGLDGAMNLFMVGPCGLILPHTHPRANEFVLVTQGQLNTQFLAEAGTPVISNNLTRYQATMFPMGSVHYELNPTCETSIFIGNFNNNDPGTLLVTPTLFSFDDVLVLNQLGGVVNGQDLESIRGALPHGPIGIIESCLERCGINKNKKRDLSEMLLDYQ